jgi:cytochrome c553
MYRSAANNSMQRTALRAAADAERRLTMRHFLSTSRLTLSFVLALVFPFSDACADARAGEKKAQLCLLCHRVESAVGAPTLEQQPSKYLVAQTNAFKSGKRIGPEMQSNVARLSAKDIQDISDYFSSQRAKPARFAADPDPKTIALGAASAKQLNCASCHSADYRGGKDVPRLAGQVPTYLVRQIAEFKRGARPHPATSAVAEKLDDPTIEALGTYFGKLEP